MNGFDCNVVGFRRRKRRLQKLPSMGDLINKSKELLGISGKKKRKTQHLEFSTDPVTGFRSNKGTYTGQKGQRKRNSELDVATCAENVDGKLQLY